MGLDLLKLMKKVFFKQLKEIPRQSIARKSLMSNGILIHVGSDKKIINIINKIAPEHLELNIKNYKSFIPKIKNAGSIFLGEFSPEAIGDYFDSADYIKIDAEDAGANLVLKGSHPDYKIIVPQTDDNKSGEIKIDQIRELHPFMMHNPARGGWRVAIIDSMDDVNRNGANALLKLLEEPPEQAILFLIASHTGHLPPTIRSRCRKAGLRS